MSRLWKKIRLRLEVMAMRWFVAILPRLSRSTLLVVADFAGDLVFSLDRKGRAVALANLDAAFGEDYLPGEKIDMARRSYRNLARTFFDLFWIGRQTPESFRELIDIVGQNEVQSGENNQLGRMFFGAHMGNFELLPLVLGLLKMPVVAIGQDIKNPAITPFFTEARAIYGNQSIPRERAALRMLRVLKRGGTSGLLIDLTLKLDEPGHLINCFGKKKWVTGIHVALSAMAGARLLPIVCLPIENGRYQFRFMPELKLGCDQSEQEITQRCWDHFEPIIRERPEYWLWNYKHWRYQPENTTDYPFYAQTSTKFQKLYSANGAMISST